MLFIFKRLGIGKELINQIISRAEKENIWTIQSGE